jgi:hypothetical protein
VVLLEGLVELLGEVVTQLADERVEDLLLDRRVDLELGRDLEAQLGHQPVVALLLRLLEAGEEAADAVVVGGEQHEGVHRLFSLSWPVVACGRRLPGPRARNQRR